MIELATIQSAIIRSTLGHPNTLSDATFTVSGLSRPTARRIPQAATTAPAVVVVCIAVGLSACQ